MCSSVFSSRIHRSSCFVWDRFQQGGSNWGCRVRGSYEHHGKTHVRDRRRFQGVLGSAGYGSLIAEAFHRNTEYGGPLVYRCLR